jgi:hypothetical protein
MEHATISPMLIGVHVTMNILGQIVKYVNYYSNTLHCLSILLLYNNEAKSDYHRIIFKNSPDNSEDSYLDAHLKYLDYNTVPGFPP